MTDPLFLIHILNYNETVESRIIFAIKTSFPDGILTNQHKQIIFKGGDNRSVEKIFLFSLKLLAANEPLY